MEKIDQNQSESEGGLNLSGAMIDQRGQNVDGNQFNIAGQVIVQIQSWHTETSSNLLWLSRFFMTLAFTILLAWFISKLDLPTFKLGMLTLDSAALKPWINNLGLRFELLNTLASSIASGMFALFTWRLSRIVASNKEQYDQQVDHIDPKKLLSSVNTSTFQLSNTDFLKERVGILKYVNSKLNFQEKPLDSITIEMQEVPDAIKSVDHSAWPSIQQATRTADITEIFNLHRTVLLLLGKPGSGKTTMIRKLCRHLYEQAIKDKTATEPIPVLLHLKSWTTRRNKIEDWLIDSLSTEYGCKRHLAKPLIEGETFIFLLDDLDQVPTEYRTQCIDALNVFCKQRRGPIVICCRTQEYYQLTTKIEAVAAYQLLPLTSKQISQYLRIAGPESAHLQTLIEGDKELKELASTPSMLNIMILGAAAKVVSPRSNKRELQQQIFDQYILSRVKSPAEKTPYALTKAIRWLRWQAQRMFEFHINTFYLEDIQPMWLVPNNQQHPLLSLAFNSGFRKIVKTLLPFISKNHAGTKTVSPYTDISWRWRSAATKLREGFVTGFNLGCWPIVFLGLLLGVLSGLILATPGELGFALVNNMYESWTKQSLPGGEIFASIPYITSIVGTLLGVVVGGLVGTLFSGPIFGILNGLLGGVVSTNVTKMMHPSQSIQRSGRFGLIAGISIGLLTAIGFGVITSLLTNSSLALIMGISLGMVVGTYTTLTSGGSAFLVHYALRYLLYLNDNIPFRYVRFLDYACNRVLLYQIGPSYMFIHPMLLEYFATLTDEDITRITAGLD